jgi:hypothetical protein
LEWDASSENAVTSKSTHPQEWRDVRAEVERAWNTPPE